MFAQKVLNSLRDVACRRRRYGALRSHDILFSSPGIVTHVEVCESRTLLTALLTLSPADGSADVPVDMNLVLTFDSNVQPGAGNIIIKKQTDNSVFESVSVPSSAVTISGSQATINLPGDFIHSTDYFVQISPNAIVDSSGNAVDGIDGPFFSWQFSTLTDLAVVPFWNGEATFPAAEAPTYNLFGGPVVASSNVVVSRDTGTVRAGTGAFRADVSVAASEIGFFGPALAGFGPDNSYVDTRDLTPYERMDFQFKNQTGVAFTLRVEVKDFTDLTNPGVSDALAVSFPIDAGNQWQSLSVPLENVVPGAIDFSRARQILFVIQAGAATHVGGAVFIDEVSFVEHGGSVPLSTASDRIVVERLAERTFRGLWGSRDHTTGLIPAISTFADQMGLNTTSMLVRSLPGAVARQWITPGEAAAYATTLVNTLNTLMNSAMYLPPRTIDRVTLEPVGLREESSVDAAFMFLGLTTFAATPGLDTTLVNDINNLLDRFNFAPFSSDQGWKLAYVYDAGVQTGNLTNGTYDGYSGEVFVISLAAHLARVGHVDISTQFNSATKVELTDLGNGNESYLVHELPEFRSPFLQWLFPLFVDVQDRGPTNNSNAAWTINPFDNAVRYQRDAIATFANSGLPLQPDAADDGTGTRYITPSAFATFGELNLTAPWSAGFALNADKDAAVAALRSYLKQSLVGPFGPVDTARFDTTTGTATQFNGRADLWNSTLWLHAAIEYLYNDNALLTNLPAVATALNGIFAEPPLPTGDVDGDADFDANDSFLIHLVQLSGTDVQIEQTKGNSPLSAQKIRANVNKLMTQGDVDGDGDFDANDSFLIHLIKLAGTDVQIDQTKGASTLTAAQIRTNVAALDITISSFTAQQSRVIANTTTQRPILSSRMVRATESDRKEVFSKFDDNETRLTLAVPDAADDFEAYNARGAFRDWIDAI